VSIGAGVARAWRPLGTAALRWQYLAFTVAAVVTAIPVVWLSLDIVPGCSITLPGAYAACEQSGTTGYFYALAGLILVAAVVVRKAPLILVALVGLTMVNAGIQWPHIYRSSSSETMHNRFLMVYDVNEEANRHGDAWFWFDMREKLGPVAVGAASVNMWGYRLVSETFPDLANSSGGEGQIFAGQLILLATDKPNPVPAAQEQVKHLGVTLALEDQVDVRRGNDVLPVYFLRVVPSGRERPLRLDDAQPATGMVSTSEAGVVQVKTPAGPYAHGAYFGIPARTAAGYGGVPAQVRVKLQVHGDNPVGIGVLTRDGTQFHGYQQVKPSKQPIDIFIKVPALAAGDRVAITNWVKGGASEVEVYSYSVLVPQDAIEAPLDEVPIDTQGLAATGGKITPRPAGLEIATTPNAWAPGALLPIAQVIPPGATGPAYVRVRVLTARGPMTIGVTDRVSKQYIVSQQVGATRRPADVYLYLPNIQQADAISIFNWDKPVEGQTTLQGASLLLPR
jgi:hypothetical protein